MEGEGGGLLTSLLSTLDEKLDNFDIDAVPIQFMDTFHVFGSVAAYLVIVFGIQRLMKDRPAFDLKPIIFLHNILLSVGSLILLILIGEQVYHKWSKHGLFAAICLWDIPPRVMALYFINYLFKYWELLDTVFLALRKKPLIFLHVYHHVMTLLLCFSQLLGGASVQWVPITLNLTVHVAMYMYYALATLKIQMWWKKYLTTMQITQFVIDLAVCWFAWFVRIKTNYGYDFILPEYNECYGTTFVAVTGISILTSYLWLFILFYISTYRKKSADAKARSAAAKAKKAQ